MSKTCFSVIRSQVGILFFCRCIYNVKVTVLLHSTASWFWSCLFAGQSPHLIQHPSSTGNIIIMLITQSHPLDMLKCKTGGESGFNTTQRTLTRTLSTRRRRRQNMENWGALNSIKIIHRKARLVQT